MNLFNDAGTVFRQFPERGQIQSGAAWFTLAARNSLRPVARPPIQPLPLRWLALAVAHLSSTNVWPHLGAIFYACLEFSNWKPQWSGASASSHRRAFANGVRRKAFYGLLRGIPQGRARPVPPNGRKTLVEAPCVCCLHVADTHPDAQSGTRIPFCWFRECELEFAFACALVRGRASTQVGKFSNAATSQLLDAAGERVD